MSMMQRSLRSRPRHGFTLIELLVVLAILGLLASLSWNGYRQHVTRSRRAEGRAAVLQVLLQQERHHARQHRYRVFAPSAGETEFRWFSGASERTSAYRIEATACPDTTDLSMCVQVTATPRAETFIDTRCGALSADTMGRRTPAGNGCW